jgi:hypothetical protein
MNTGGNLVGVIGALLVPLVAHSFASSSVGWVIALSTGALFALTGAVLWTWIRADIPMGSLAHH